MATMPVHKASTITSSVPGIQYMLTAYVDEKGKFSEKPTSSAIHDVVRVVSGTLADVMCLLPYRDTDVFTLLTLNKVLNKTDRIMAHLEKRTKIITDSFVVIYGDTLYGVVIKDSEARVIGPIQHVLSSIHEDKTDNCLVLGGNANMPGRLNLTKCWDLTFNPENHVLVVVPLGGYCFVQYVEASDESGDQDIDGVAREQPGLALLMGTSFLLLDSVELKWHKFKDAYQKHPITCTVEPGNALFMYANGCVIEDGGFALNGFGARTSNLNEAYYYALMHLGKSFKRQSINE